MQRVFDWVKNKVAAPASDEFIEMEHQKQDPKVSIRTMQLTCFDDTKKIAAVLREGRTIMLLDVSTLKEKDVIDLKRSVNKLKGVSAEMGAEIAGLGGDWIVLAPGFAEIYRPKPIPQAPEMSEVSEVQ
ncbi:MAG: cell division protein SepF [Candidatus Nanoarchaeia archaeon]|nr:cell division protein SepF [Candidatus Nanoarchaeia archaeon]